MIMVQAMSSQRPHTWINGHTLDAAFLTSVYKSMTGNTKKKKKILYRDDQQSVIHCILDEF